VADTNENDLQALWDQEVASRESGEPVVEEKALETAPEEKPEAVPAQAEDPYAGVSPAVRAKLEQIDQLANANSQMLHQLKSAEGRVAAFQRELTESKKAQATASVAPTQTDISRAAADPEEWAQLKSDFPEWGRAMEAFVDARLQGVRAGEVDPSKIDELVAARLASGEAGLMRKVSEVLVENRHAGWKQTVNTPEFLAWMSVQDEGTKALASSEDSLDAIKLLDGFKSAQAKPVTQIKQERNSRLAAAAAPRRPNSPAPRGEEELTPEEIWNLEAARTAKLKQQRGY
jgi:hypothetical protein